MAAADVLADDVGGRRPGPLFALVRVQELLLVVDEDELDGQGVWSPKWVPDGSAVVFMSNLDAGMDTWIINTDGTDLQRLTFESRMMPRAVALLP